MNRMECDTRGVTDIHIRVTVVQDMAYRKVYVASFEAVVIALSSLLCLFQRDE